MNKQYPQNLKEALIMAIPNCTTMVLCMMTLNLWIYGALTWGHFFAAFIPIWLSAFGLDFFVVGPLCMIIGRRTNSMKYMPFYRVAMMASILTFWAPILETGYVPLAANYIIAFPRNYIAALLFQVFLARRVGLYVLARAREIKTRKNKRV